MKLILDIIRMIKLLYLQILSMLFMRTPREISGLEPLTVFFTKHQEKNHLEDVLAHKSALNYIHKITSFSKEKFLIGICGSGLLLLDLERSTISDFLADKLKLDKINIVRIINRDNEGNLWIGTDGDDILHID